MTHLAAVMVVGEESDFIDHPISLLGRAATQSRVQNLELAATKTPPAIIHRSNYQAEFRVPGVARGNELRKQREESGRVSSGIAEEPRGEFAQFQFATGVGYSSGDGAIQ